LRGRAFSTIYDIDPGDDTGEEGKTMLIDQGDLLWGMDFLFVNDFMAVSDKVHFEKGTVIFREGDKADYFYTLVEGRVRLTIGEPAN